MEQDGDLLPKKNPIEGERYEGREPEFAEEENSVRERLALTGGKTLLVFDGLDPVFAEAACGPRAIAVVFDGDSLPLFSMPDGVSRVLASGDAALLQAARYFAEIRGVPCVLYPVHAALDGVLEERGTVRIGREEREVPLKAAEGVICDRSKFKGTIPEGYARLLLARLAALEGEALAYFSGMEQPEKRIAEQAADLTAEGIILANFRQREKERNGFPAGEGKALAALLKEHGERYPFWRAYLQLSALYAAFFEKGKPRRYFTPDYRKRAASAGEAVFTVPTAEEYVLRAMTLERIRASFARAAAAISDEREEQAKIMSALAGEVVLRRAGELKYLKILPERAPDGLCAVIRDFGLMEWDL